MSLINQNWVSFSQIDDPIRTEETIFNQLKEVDLGLPLVSLPIAFSINKFGVPRTQQMIDEIERKESCKKIYVCQHILVNKLSFGENMVFTPHTLEEDSYNFVPHYNPAFQEKIAFTRTSDRNFNFSFMGDYNTNSIREEIGKRFSGMFPVQQTGKWFFSHDSATQQHLKSNYKRLLEDTKFPLCPQGTGPSTLRFFESLSSGGFPVIFNSLKLPSDIRKYVIKSSIEDLENRDFEKSLERFDDSLQEEMVDLYWSRYSNENLSLSIIERINQL